MWRSCNILRRLWLLLWPFSYGLNSVKLHYWYICMRLQLQFHNTGAKLQ
jgi:hypothetical protein